MVKMGGNTKGSKQALVRVVWSQPLRRQYSVEIKDQVYQEMWMVEWLFRSSFASEIPSACSFGECKFRGFEGLAEQRYHFVLRGPTWYHPRTSAGNERSGDCSRIVAVSVTRVECLQHTWRKVPSNAVFRKTRCCRGGTGKQH